MRKILPILFFLFLFSQVFAAPVKGAISACDATVDVSSVSINTTQDYNFSVTNNDEAGARMVWIKITVPSGNFTIVDSGSEYTLTGFDAGPGSPQSQTLSVTSGASAASSASWTIQASDDAGGASPTTCSGSLGTAITDPADSQAPTISSLTVSSVTSSSIVVSWTTDKSSNSVVSYGTTNAYGSTKSDSTLSTSHSLTIDSLSADTTYHYKVASTDGNSNTTETSDNTFATSKSGTTTTTTTTTTTVVATPTPGPKKAVDKTGPVITFSLDSKKVFEVAPTWSGKASDTAGVTRVDYSVDGGVNWLPVDELSKKGSSATFEFTPVGLEDGDYKLKLRAYDGNSNVGSSKIYDFVIDRLPPLVGGNLISIGPQVLMPHSTSVLVALAGLDQKITLSAVGGPTTIDLIAQNESGDKQTFSLVKSTETGLWSGALSFGTPGIYTLTAKAIDGAGNKTDRKINKVLVVSSGRVLGEISKNPVEGARVTVFYLEPRSKRWTLWDGAALGQKNPQKLGQEGQYLLFLPVGTYYMKIDGKEFSGITTSIFTLEKPTPVNSDFTMKFLKKIKIFGLRIPIPDFSGQTVPVSIKSPEVSSEEDGKETLVSKESPLFTLKTIGEKEFSLSSMRGRQSVLSFINTWSPPAIEQVSYFDKFLQRETFKGALVVEQETLSKTTIFQKRGNYKTVFVVDSDGKLIDPYGLATFPVHFFLDRKGVVRKVVTGVLDENEIESNLLEI